MGDVSRRAVLGAGVVAAGAAALGCTEAEAAIPPRALTRGLPARSTYAKSLGKSFTARLDGHNYGLRLKYIHDLANTTAGQRERSFVLVFAPVDGAHLHDGTYMMHSAAVGAHELFLSAIGTNHGMQAVVNRTR